MIKLLFITTLFFTFNSQASLICLSFAEKNKKHICKSESRDLKQSKSHFQFFLKRLSHKEFSLLDDSIEDFMIQYPAKFETYIDLRQSVRVNETALNNCMDEFIENCVKAMNYKMP